MTYCLAIQVRRGLVFASDSRTNAGVDNIGTFSKMHLFERPGDRILVVLTAGNLAVSQTVIHRLRREFATHSGGLNDAADVYAAADYLGAISRAEQDRHAEVLARDGVSVETSFIIGGQVTDASPELCLVYPQGNYIAATAENPYLQMGETKYGKPILDRIIDADTTLDNAARCALVSLDSTIRANISVGPPLDLAIYEADSLAAPRRLTLGQDNPLYLGIQQGWNAGLKQAFVGLPRFEWEE